MERHLCGGGTSWKRRCDCEARAYVAFAGCDVGGAPSTRSNPGAWLRCAGAAPGGGVGVSQPRGLPDR